jgi:small subunit ribosomal protein S21
MVSALPKRLLVPWLKRDCQGSDERSNCPLVKLDSPTTEAPTHMLHRRNNFLQVFVRDNNVDQALKVLKRRLQREGVFREMKRRRFYEKPSERSARERSEAVRRMRKLKRKQAQREGLLPAPKKKVVTGGLRGRPSERRPGR